MGREGDGELDRNKIYNVEGTFCPNFKCSGMKHADRFCFEQWMIAHIEGLCVAMKDPFLLYFEDAVV